MLAALSADNLIIKHYLTPLCCHITKHLIIVPIHYAIRRARVPLFISHIPLREWLARQRLQDERGEGECRVYFWEKIATK